ncbi:hypothetical protein B0I33_105385 [Prauserella shujinwangii]|uniref:MFS transporter n=1 Tax=Prauserella shujinwangii TaxID=1453103 RepID=A0A2T0LVD3_9PSEU|nr:hypothetical protein [Prauserella shujinwangii]PRX47802.1 hypothetical protein B0I33_105385 [Prauserella shujinwangii]
MNSAYGLFGIGGAAVGSLVSGPIADAFGITAPFWAAGAVMAAVTALAWRTFGRRLLAHPGD